MNPLSLQGKKGLIVGVANDKSIAYGCAKAFKLCGADLAITYLNEKAKKFVEPIAEELNAPIFLPCDVQNEEQIDHLFEKIKEEWGGFDFFLHSIAFAPLEDLHGRVIDSSKEGFLHAMDISCHSFIRMAQKAEPLMKQGGTLLTLSFYGAQKVVPNYSVMGPIKATLESVVQYMAYEFGQKAIRVHAISPGLVRTRAATGIKNIESMFHDWGEKTPGLRFANKDDIGKLATFLVSDWSEAMTGNVIPMDAGYHIMS